MRLQVQETSLLLLPQNIDSRTCALRCNLYGASGNEDVLLRSVKNTQTATRGQIKEERRDTMLRSNAELRIAHQENQIQKLYEEINQLKWENFNLRNALAQLEREWPVAEGYAAVAPPVQHLYMRP